jgi:hypothetical protein
MGGGGYINLRGCRPGWIISLGFAPLTAATESRATGASKDFDKYIDGTSYTLVRSSKKKDSFICS